MPALTCTVPPDEEASTARCTLALVVDDGAQKLEGVTKTLPDFSCTLPRFVASTTSATWSATEKRSAVEVLPESEMPLKTLGVAFTALSVLPTLRCAIATDGNDVLKPPSVNVLPDTVIVVASAPVVPATEDPPESRLGWTFRPAMEVVPPAAATSL